VNILISGASGNLGCHTSRHLLSTPHRLNLLTHTRALPADIASHANVTILQGDLGRPETLTSLCAHIDCVVHLAGLLFAPRPEKFLPRTNVEYVVNLAKAALKAGVKKFVLVSFPHAEGETTPEHPAVGTLDGHPKVIHFRTRLEAERKLIAATGGTSMRAVIFRAGIVYGRDIKLIKAARWMLRHGLMAVWPEPTWLHLIALPDFLAGLQAAIENENTAGIYQVCDNAPLLLQDLLDRLARHWHCRGPISLPGWTFYAIGNLCEFSALLLHTPVPLNRDIVSAGMTSCVADTTRMKRELLQKLSYPTIEEGMALL